MTTGNGCFTEGLSREDTTDGKVALFTETAGDVGECCWPFDDDKPIRPRSILKLDNREREGRGDEVLRERVLGVGFEAVNGFCESGPS